MQVKPKPTRALFGRALDSLGFAVVVSMGCLEVNVSLLWCDGVR